MEKQYIDLLMVEKQDGSVVLVTIESHEAEVGSIVEFNGGELGRIVKKAWGGEKDGDVFDLITSMIPAYEAEAYYRRRWEAQDGHEAVS